MVKENEDKIKIIEAPEDFPENLKSVIRKNNDKIHFAGTSLAQSWMLLKKYGGQVQEEIAVEANKTMEWWRPVDTYLDCVESEQLNHKIMIQAWSEYVEDLIRTISEMNLSSDDSSLGEAFDLLLQNCEELEKENFELRNETAVPEVKQVEETPEPVGEIPEEEALEEPEPEKIEEKIAEIPTKEESTENNKPRAELNDGTRIVAVDPTLQNLFLELIARFRLDKKAINKFKEIWDKANFHRCCLKEKNRFGAAFMLMAKKLELNHTFKEVSIETGLNESNLYNSFVILKLEFRKW